MRKSDLTNVIDLVFKDKHGKWGVVQFPNILLSTWIVVTVALFFIHSPHLHAQVSMLQNAILFAWAYLELTDGLSYFRKALGGIILVAVVIGFLR